MKKTAMMGRLVFVAVAAAALSTHAFALQDQGVWYWFSSCGGPMMTVEVKLDGARLSRITAPVCKAPRGSGPSQGQGGRHELVFQPPRALTWSGYAVTAVRTRARDRIEANLWQAGAEADALLIGVSFVAGDRILANTIHIAHPERRDESVIAEGVVVLTYPTPTDRKRE